MRKSKLKSQKKVKVTKTTSRNILLPFMEEPTGEPRRSKRRKDKDKMDDDDETMVH